MAIAAGPAPPRPGVEPPLTLDRRRAPAAGPGRPDGAVGEPRRLAAAAGDGHLHPRPDPAGHPCRSAPRSSPSSSARVIGNVLLGLGALPGAETGAPAMVLLRGLLGRRGSYLPTAAQPGPVRRLGDLRDRDHRRGRRPADRRVAAAALRRAGRRGWRRSWRCARSASCALLQAGARCGWSSRRPSTCSSRSCAGPSRPLGDGVVGRVLEVGRPRHRPVGVVDPAGRRLQPPLPQRPAPPSSAPSSATACRGTRLLRPRRARPRRLRARARAST